MSSKKQIISTSDLTKVSSYLADYYQQEQIQIAIEALKQWYVDERFDDDDFTNDWIPSDFENCDGIDIFINNLSDLEEVNNNQNKRVLFDWFCYLLLPNINKPTEEPTKDLPLDQVEFHNTLMEQIGIQLAELLRFRCDGVDDKRAEEIKNFFVKLCNDRQVM